MTYRLIALDIDGTLLNSKGKITQGVKAAIDEVRAAGIQVTLATGRRNVTAHRIATEIGLGIAYAVHNGALTIGPQDGTEIRSYRLTGAWVAEVAELARQGPYTGFFFSGPENDETVYYEVEPSHRRAQDFVHNPYGDVTQVEDVVPVDRGGFLKVLFLDTPARIDTLFATLDEAFSHRLRLLKYARPGAPTWAVEVFHPNASKGQAVADIALGLGITRSEIAAVGDDVNDIDLLRAAGLGIAMANGVKALHAVANAVTRSNDDDGVAWALRDHVLPRIS